MSSASASFSSPSSVSKTVSSPSSNRSPSTSTSEQDFDSAVQPIATLNPYLSRWTIKGRVIAKTERKQFSGKNKNPGVVSSVDFLDHEGTQIKISMFNKACEKFEHMFLSGKVYYIRGKRGIKMANKAFSRVPNDYEINLDENTSEVRLAEDDLKILHQQFKFVPISEIEKSYNSDFVDIVGILRSVSPVTSFIPKNKQERLSKRTITLMDQTLKSIDVTLWGQTAENFMEKKDVKEIEASHPVIAIKGARVTIWQGRQNEQQQQPSPNTGSRTLSASSEVYINLDRPEAKKLQQWYEELLLKGTDIKEESLTKKFVGGDSSAAQRLTLGEIQAKQLGQVKPEYVSVRGWISMFKTCSRDNTRQGMFRPPWYKACPNVACKNHKVGEDNVCSQCGKKTENPNLRLILPCQIIDSSSSIWCTAFDADALAILEKKAEQLDVLWQQEKIAEVGEDKSTEYSQVFQHAVFRPFFFRLRVHYEAMPGDNSDMRQRMHIAQAKPINLQKECLHMLEAISRYNV
eukprot:TRINITY_DN2586_c0_g1_i1.p1 TRINITY_DN2586_c0_g1~~TRINITY_DN2586_c0_g1_i1.p1  ORF type:complete len:542 (-),score=74.52 TRINITY_DN2586_c0_g1_i1:249-1802(-)